MDIQVGDRVTYKYLNTSDKRRITRLVNNEYEIEDYKNMFSDIEKENAIEILKVERPKYETIEEKKELLTEDEKEFLKYYIRLITIENDIDYVEKDGTYIYIYKKDQNFYRADIEYNTFNNLKENAEYTLSELRFGGIKC